MKLEPLENERWVWAKTFKNDYSDEYLVSDMGRCWSIRNGKFVGHWANGYWTVGLSKNGNIESMMVGRLMLISFGIPILEHLQCLPANKLQAMHLDGNRENNSLENFQWGDAKENQNEENCKRSRSEVHKGKHLSEETKRKISEAKKGKYIGYWLGKYGDKHPMYGKYGKEHPISKPILQYSKDGVFLKEWECAMDVQRELKIKQTNISMCARGKRPSAGGYIWKYKEEAV